MTKHEATSSILLSFSFCTVEIKPDKIAKKFSNITDTAVFPSYIIRWKACCAYFTADTFIILPGSNLDFLKQISLVQSYVHATQHKLEICQVQIEWFEELFSSADRAAVCPHKIYVSYYILHLKSQSFVVCLSDKKLSVVHKGASTSVEQYSSAPSRTLERTFPKILWE